MMIFLAAYLLISTILFAYLITGEDSPHMMTFPLVALSWPAIVALAVLKSIRKLFF